MSRECTHKKKMIYLVHAAQKRKSKSKSVFLLDQRRDAAVEMAKVDIYVAGTMKSRKYVTSFSSVLE